MCLTLRRAAGYNLLNAAYRQVRPEQVNTSTWSLSCFALRPLCVFTFRWGPVSRTRGRSRWCGGPISTSPVGFWDLESSPCWRSPRCPQWETLSTGGSLHLFRWWIVYRSDSLLVLLSGLSLFQSLRQACGCRSERSVDRLVSPTLCPAAQLRLHHSSPSHRLQAPPCLLGGNTL